MSAGFTSGDVLSAKSYKILPPVRMGSRPSDLAPFQRRGLIHRENPVKTLLIPWPRCNIGGAEKRTNPAITVTAFGLMIVAYERIHYVKCVIEAMTYTIYIHVLPSGNASKV
jgi:hypothetical protein